jgi:tRNA A-37 threonylcarbamoyl transferase component Bud32
MVEKEPPREPPEADAARVAQDAERAVQPGSLAETVEQPVLEAVAPARHEVVRGPEEVFPLWRQRLRLAAILLFVGFTVLLGRRSLQVAMGIPPETAAGWFLYWCHAAVTGILGLFTLLLFSRQPSSAFRLLAAEIALFGLPAVLFVASQYFVILRSCSEQGVLAFSAGPWLLLVFVYALFIPSTLARATVVIGSVSMAPVLLVFGMFLTHPPVTSVLTVDDLAGVLLTFLLAAVGGVIGVNKIDFLRREAFRAKQLGQYRLGERIGTGGMGDVFLAEHEMLKRPCVVKLIRPDRVGDEKTLARFQREVQATAHLSHWNTVEILDYGRTEDGTLYYVMEYLPGMSLAEMVGKHGPLPPERVLYLLLQACDALREAHQAGLVHRDIKPENIVVAQRGGVYDVAKLLDFGLVEPIARKADRHPKTEGAITGSPLFMSPEQAAGSVAADPRTDIYSLGAVAYYLLTGRPPLLGRNLVELMDAHKHREPVPPSQRNPQVPGDLEQIVLQCLAKDPRDRYQDMNELRRALSQCEAAGRWGRAEAAGWWRKHEPGAR